MLSSKVSIAHAQGFRISFDGEQVTCPARGSVSKWKTKAGYVYFWFGTRKLGGKIMAHRLQGFQKYGDQILDPKKVCRHLDGNPSNNHHDNIAIGSHSDNMFDQPKELRHSKAMKASRHILKYDHVAVIKFYRENGFNNTIRAFGLNKGGLSYIINKTHTGTPVPKSERPSGRFPAIPA